MRYAVVSFRATFALTALVLGVSISSVRAIEHPCILVNQSEILAVKKKVDAGAEPWKTASRDVLSKASRALSHTPYKFAEPITPIENPKRLQLWIHGELLANLGWAWYLTGEEKYKTKAREMVDAFYINPTTRCTPSKGNVGSNSGLSAIAGGTDLVWPILTAEQQTAVAKWYKDYRTLTYPVREFGAYFSNHNRAFWWVTAISYSTIMMGAKDNLLDSSYEHWRRFRESTVTGGTILSTDRSKPQPGDNMYHDFILAAAHWLLEIARHQGVDLYNFDVKEGRSKYERTMDGYTNYASTNPDRWAWEMYEIAYGYKQKPKWDAVVKMIGRPINFIEWSHGFGPLTLSHYPGAYQFLKGTSTNTPVRPVARNNAGLQAHSAYYDICGRLLEQDPRAASMGIVLRKQGSQTVRTMSFPPGTSPARLPQ